MSTVFIMAQMRLNLLNPVCPCKPYTNQHITLWIVGISATIAMKAS